MISKIDALSPLKTLTRGYCIAIQESGETINSVKKIKSNEMINLKFHDGEKKAKIL